MHILRDPININLLILGAPSSFTDRDKTKLKNQGNHELKGNIEPVIKMDRKISNATYWS